MSSDVLQYTEKREEDVVKQVFEKAYLLGKVNGMNGIHICPRTLYQYLSTSQGTKLTNEQILNNLEAHTEK